MIDGRVVVLLRSSSVARAPVYRHLRSLGAILVLVHPYHPMPEFDGVFHHWLKFDTDDVAAVRVALQELLTARNLKPDAIVSFDEYAVFQAAALAESFQLTPVPLPSAAIRQNNLKDRFRLFCAEHRINSPKSVCLPLPLLLSLEAMRTNAQTEELCDSVFDEVRAEIQNTISTTLTAASITFPVVLKPSPGAGSLLARLCADIDEATRHVWCMLQTLSSYPDKKHLLAVVRGAGDSVELPESPASPYVQILAEEFISGQEVDIDCVVERGVVRFCSISDNFAPSPPYFAEVGGRCPSTLDFEAQRALRDLLESYVVACGDQLHGVLHFEAKYDFTRRTAYVIEVNCRPGSAETNTMINTVYRGMSLGESLVRCALQQPVREQLVRLFPEVMLSSREPNHQHLLINSSTGASPMKEDGSSASELDELAVPMWRALGGLARGFYPPQCWAASVNVYPRCAGVLRKVQVPIGDPSLVAFSVSASPGEIVAPPPKRFFLLSWIVARGKTAVEAQDNIEHLAANFVQEVEPQLTV
ncbi:hypothetical protein ABL78_7141 [Leptomonas seymouri]|uniref:ATP-grasp domain-containing protein n=1 Tax=Leptomonas seymouri TaxID=5684 RepID=A0A0N0P380_LEPSE|nr:hypothetical protein ABL78_7141 [Leptomonas seymouri]|eukprot:KPI83819.1 hypothetical protein ABL78_7141 [Leptomonas seymouri]